MNSTFILTINDENCGVRLDKVISESYDLTRNAVQKLIDDEEIFVNGKSAAKNYKTKLNDKIVINIPEIKKTEAFAQNIPLEILYEDRDLLVVNKPKDMVVHPAAGNFENTLVNALMFYCGDNLSTVNGNIRPGIVHRIDKDTSGLLVVAKNDMAHISLAHQIKEHSFTRAYEAVVYGVLKNDKGTISAPIGRHPKERKKMSVTLKNSKNATTHYEVIKRYDKFTHVRLTLETGRTHQIRVHMAYIGHPVAGDAVYGPKKVIASLNGQCLHAKLIGFIHPRSGQYMEVDSELPDYFKDFLNKLKSTEKEF